MTPLTPDPETAALLEQIRQRAEQVRIAPALTKARDWACINSAHDVPLLLAAIEAVLKRHVPVPDGPEWCRECGHSFPCWTRRNITSALRQQPAGNTREQENER